jgi:hypothetical protein
MSDEWRRVGACGGYPEMVTSFSNHGVIKDIDLKLFYNLACPFFIAGWDLI